MLDTRVSRVLAVVVLLTVLAVSFPLYAQQPFNPEAHVYPSEADFTDDPTRYVGDRVEVTGQVRQTEPLVVQFGGSTDPYTVTVVDHALSPEPGDKLRLVGVLTSPDEIRVIDGFVVPQRGRWYAWGVSFVAGLWVLWRLVKHWQVDRSTLGFAPRDEPISIRTLATRRSGERGNS
jgi:hypothetical protein